VVIRRRHGVLAEEPCRFVSEFRVFDGWQAVVPLPKLPRPARKIKLRLGQEPNDVVEVEAARAPLRPNGK